VTVDIDPPELASLLDLAERPRVEDWSLRAALVRYAQPEPERVGALLNLVRRAESALRPHSKFIEKNGPAVWSAVSGQGGDDVDPFIVEVLRAMTELDKLGDAVATWAVGRKGERPDAAVDAVTNAVAARFGELGVAHEEPPRPSGRRG
jgi:hypothetical protein